MGKKTPEERATAHARFEQSQAAKKKGKIAVASLSDEQIKAALDHCMEICPDQTQQQSGLPKKVLTNLANGRFTADGQQAAQIVTAARQMGWEPDPM